MSSKVTINLNYWLTALVENYKYILRMLNNCEGREATQRNRHTDSVTKAGLELIKAA